MFVRFAKSAPCEYVSIFSLLPVSGVMPERVSVSLSLRNERLRLPIAALNPELQPCRLYCLVDAMTLRLRRSFQGSVCW